MTESTLSFLQMYSMCKLFSVLPMEGGLNDQTANFVSATTIVEGVISDVAKEQENNG